MSNARHCKLELLIWLQAWEEFENDDRMSRAWRDLGLGPVYASHLALESGLMPQVQTQGVSRSSLAHVHPTHTHSLFFIFTERPLLFIVY
jgi:hypothetical protein